jgi:hypothetical protein
MSLRHPPFLRKLACAALAGAGTLASGAASALVLAPAQTTFYLTGTCSDCTLQAAPLIGTLVLEGYIPGTAITNSHFLAFAYHGSDLIEAFTVTRDDRNPVLTVGNAYTFFLGTTDAVSGSIGASGGGSNFRIDFQDGIGLETSASGTWFACAPGIDGYYSGGTCSLFRHNDVGMGSWSMTAPPVPEPASLLLMAAGVAGLAGLSARRRAGASR